MRVSLPRPLVPSPYLDLPVDHLLILPPNLVARYRIGAGLRLADVEAVDDSSESALRVGVEGLDYKALVEGIGAELSACEKRDTLVAVVPRWADDVSRRRAIAAARPLSELLDEYSASWVCGVLKRGALRVHFQPLVQYPPGRVHGYECLLRGVSLEGKLISPARLFDAAGRLGMQYLLDHQSARVAVAGAAQVGFSNTQYFINLMAGAIGDAAVSVQSMLKAVVSGGLRPAQVTFEIVDAEACGSRRHLLEVVETYRDAGFRISLDDVGAGGASLLSLEELRPDYVKLDAGLCRRASTNDTEAQLLRDLAEAARQQGIVAVAKGLESAEELRFVMDMGVRVTQGYVHAEAAPMPLDSLAEDRVMERVRLTAGERDAA